MNDVVDTELVHRLRRQYGGSVRDPDLSAVRARARHLERRRRRVALTATAVAAASASVLTVALVSFDGDDNAQLSTEGPSTSVADSTTITTRPVADTTNRQNAQVKVLVANGSGRDGYASQMHQDLVTLGYSSLGAENARMLPLPTVIYYRDTYREDAKQLAKSIGAPEALVQAIPESLGERLEPPVVVRAQVANVVIILGNEVTTFHATVTTTGVPVADTAHPHSHVKVFVANGAGRDGYATQMNQDLTMLGYATLGPHAARPIPLPTVIYYRDSYREDAKQLAKTIGAPEALVQPMPESLGERLEPAVVMRAQEANVVIILGNETTPFQATSSTTVGTMVPSTSRG